jgi:virginiamycin B lyase
MGSARIVRPLLGIALSGLALALPASAPAAAVDTWTLRAVPPPAFNFETKLNGVSCTASSACTAVGLTSNFSSGGKKVPLAERWNGEVWTTQTTLVPEKSEEALLMGVSCGSSTACMAVGRYKAGGVVKALAESWNGTSWSIPSLPSPEGALEARLEAISCSSSTACTAVGYYRTSKALVPLAERWNGTKWELQTIAAPEKSFETVLLGVSCPASNACSAAGSYVWTGGLAPLAERWNGEKWTQQSVPVPEKSEEARFQAISCSSSTSCSANGYYEGAGIQPLAEGWKKEAWETQSTPTPKEAVETSFKAVSCGAEAACMGTGSYSTASSSFAFAESFNGSSWTLQSPKNPGGTKPVLAGISCVSSRWCMAVGSYTEKTETETLVPVPFSENYNKVETPFNIEIPSISPAAPETGKQETASNGTWGNEPGSYAYQWKRCNASGLECVNILGADKSTYSPLTADAEHTLVVEVTATNVAGSASAVSKATEKVKLVGSITEYSLPSSSTPEGIAPGPDGNLWFTNGGTNKIGKITTGGTVTEYSSTEGGGPIGIAKGSDGNLWFAMASPGSRVGKITTSGTVTYFKLSKGMANGRDIAAGPDGNLWFTSTEGNVGKITTSGTFTAYASSGQPTGIAAGPDGNVWFTQNTGNKIVKTTTSGTMTEYSPPAATNLWGLVSGPDEKLWFTASGKIGKITTGGTVTEYSVGAGEIKGITEGPDGLLWFANYGGNKIGKITTGGTVTEYSLPTGSNPWDVAAGSDGNVWFTESGSNRIGMISP